MRDKYYVTMWLVLLIAIAVTGCLFTFEQEKTPDTTSTKVHVQGANSVTNNVTP